MFIKSSVILLYIQSLLTELKNDSRKNEVDLIDLNSAKNGGNPVTPF
ncbi:hypothetical protein HMPREF0758_1927 [Serratia odorifera DSM 4582]|uniref:Uncharacterized protein n=1 Tax=Serratia odorifera DSM 4582 TaxID=667129 RepID=D4E1F3_SEROD|nr:hypothetical protein HMPREF0758_1927 [Serratia odorifera DSM 4582]